AGKPPRLAGMTPPSPLPRPEQIGKIALPRQGGQSPLADGASGLIGRESGGPTFPPAADASRLAPLSLPASASGTEHGRGDSPALLATPPAAAPSQPLTIRHPLAPTPFLPASARPADLAQGAGAGDGLAPSSAHPAAPLSLSSLDGAGGGPARALTNPQQPMAGQQQAQAATQLGLALQYRIGRQETKFALRLDPPELGRVEVSLKLHEGGRVDALIRTEHSHTLDLLQRDVRVLERAFHQLGLKPEGGIQFASGQQGHGHSGSAFSQAQQDGMGQPHAGGGHGDGGRENPTGDMTPQSASGEGREMGMPDEGSRERPVMAARVGVDVKV
ncbi:MAG: flagellar hook-length control protein FliK, partial [Alphaproteobacteria bacterium]